MESCHHRLCHQSLPASRWSGILYQGNYVPLLIWLKQSIDPQIPFLKPKSLWVDGVHAVWLVNVKPPIYASTMATYCPGIIIIKLRLDQSHCLWATRLCILSFSLLSLETDWCSHIGSPPLKFESSYWDRSTTDKLFFQLILMKRSNDRMVADETGSIRASTGVPATVTSA